MERGRLSDTEKEELKDLGFMVNDARAEREEMLRYIDRLASADYFFAAKVVMNLDCNLACRYCFEGQRKGKYYMTAETSDLFINYVRNNFLKNKREIRVTFYGGEPLLSMEMVLYMEAIMKRGYKVHKIMPMMCLMDMKDRVTVNYDGSLYKCPGLIGRNEFSVGDLKTGIGDYSISHNLDNWKNDECLDCAYLPLCFGGCRYMKLVRDGNMNGVDCKKPFLDATLETMVKQDIKYGLVPV